MNQILMKMMESGYLLLGNDIDDASTEPEYADEYDIPIAGVNENNINQNENKRNNVNENEQNNLNENNLDQDEEVMEQNNIDINQEAMDIVDGNINVNNDNNNNQLELHEENNNQPNHQVEAYQPNIEQEMNEAYGPRNNDYNLRPRRPRDYSHLHTVLEGTVMTQHNMKKGIKLFAQDGVDAVLKELKQLHDRGVLEPQAPNSLSNEEKKASLQYLMFLKKKRNGTIKGRGCADGRRQRLYTNKEDASSATVAIESVLLTSVIDAHEGRDVATVDIPGAFIQADIDDISSYEIRGYNGRFTTRNRSQSVQRLCGT
jgi:hypothetical protein